MSERDSVTATGAAAAVRARDRAALSGQDETHESAIRPEFAERVAELAREYAAGTYRVDAAAVSAKIVDRHLRK